MKTKTTKNIEDDYQDLDQLYNSINFIEFSNSCVQISISTGTADLEQDPQLITDNYSMGFFESLYNTEEEIQQAKPQPPNLPNVPNNILGLAPPEPANFPTIPPIITLDISQVVPISVSIDIPPSVPPAMPLSISPDMLRLKVNELNQFSSKIKNPPDFGYSISDTASRMESVSLPSASTMNSNMSLNMESQYSFNNYDHSSHDTSRSLGQHSMSKMYSRTVESQKCISHEEELKILQNILFDKLKTFFVQMHPTFVCKSFKELMIYRNKYLAVTKSNIILNWKQIAKEMTIQSNQVKIYNEKILYSMFLTLQRRALDGWPQTDIQAVKRDIKTMCCINGITDKRQLKRALEDKYHFTEQYDKNLKQMMDVIDQTFKVFTTKK